MSAVSITGAGVLQNATPAQLEQAVAQNHRELFYLEALALGGEVRTRDGLVWTYGGAAASAAVVFPSMADNHAGALLDEMMAYFRAHPPNAVGCWSLAHPQPADIGTRLLARGFQPGWAPCWMALDLDEMNDNHPVPPGLQIRADNHTDVQQVKDLPYAIDNGGAARALRRTYPDRIQRFIAYLDGEIVAHSSVLFTTGDYGVGGIYNVSVVPQARNRGIGKAITLAACRYAKERGYRYTVLNAAARHLYELIGFKWINNGLTWWLVGNRYITQPPSAAQVALAEATGRSDTAALDKMGHRFTPADLNTPITNGMTLMQLAVHCRQPASAEWLIAHGAICSALDAWDLGWKDRAAALLIANPQEVNRLYDQEQLTILHTAAQRNDIELARLALAAKPDLRIKDTMHGGTPLDWAEYFRRPEITALIKAAAGKR
jgi:ribosomal protein S18 acetylase RimI-like enzyme